MASVLSIRKEGMSLSEGDGGQIMRGWKVENQCNNVYCERKMKMKLNKELWIMGSVHC